MRRAVRIQRHAFAGRGDYPHERRAATLAGFGRGAVGDGIADFRSVGHGLFRGVSLVSRVDGFEVFALMPAH